jgi:prephenate dehydratase
MLHSTMTSLVFLGPAGTFTHQAALALAPAGATLSPLNTLDDVLAALSEGRASYAVAAHLSAAGPIAATQSAIASGAYEVLNTHAIAVSFDLYGRPGDTCALIGVYGHEKALAQIRAWTAPRGLQTRTAASNTAGLAAVRDGAEAGWCAVGPPGLASQYRLEVRANALEGPGSNETVFVLLRRAADAG